MKDYVVYDQAGRKIIDKTGLNYYSKDNDKFLQDIHPQFKSAVLRASPSVVSVVSLGVPPEMIRCTVRGSNRRSLPKDQVYVGPGFFIECEKNAGDDKFSTTILTSVEVYLPNGDKCGGKVFACDFHYNLAVFDVQLDSPVQLAKLRDLDDIMPIHVTNQSHSNESQSFELCRHSSSFKILPGDTVATIARCTTSDIAVSFGEFRFIYFIIYPYYFGCALLLVDTFPLLVQYYVPGLDCKELYSIFSEDPDFQVPCGSPVINCNGEVIGIYAAGRSFLPSNIISRWWNYYKNRKMYCRPWLGLNVANLQLANFNFLERLIRSFPNVSSGVIVTEVVENSVSFSSGLRREDVIVQCDGATVGSILDFFDKIWDKSGSSVELSVLRKMEHINIKVTVVEPESNDFYRWCVPPWITRPGLPRHPFLIQTQGGIAVPSRFCLI